MDARKICSMVIVILFFGALVLAGPIKMPSGNQSMHDVQQSEQRNVTTGGAGIPGGKNPYFATTFPMPSPAVRR